MNGSMKWVGGIAAAVIVGIVGWLFHTVQDDDKTIAAMVATMDHMTDLIGKLQASEAKDISELKASLEKAKDDIEDLQKGKR